MRKLKIAALAVVFSLVVYGAVNGHTLMATMQKEREAAYLWINDLSRSPGDPAYLSVYYRLRKAYFAVEPKWSAHPVVFLGDSITDDGEWSKLFPGVAVENRGIGGDTTAGVLNRLDQVIALKPSRIFLMIGTNDLCFNRPIPDSMANYRLIIDRLHAALPNTPIYIESVLPFNDTIFPSNYLRTNKNIRLMNVRIRELAGKEKCPYIDLTPAFTNKQGRLYAKYTTDGLHLNDQAYQVWKQRIKGWVEPGK